MEEKAKQIVANWLKQNWQEKWDGKTYQIFLVWNSKVLQNYKCTIYTNLPNSPYFELTYNGDKKEWYLDVYVKLENKVIVDKE